MSRSPFGGRRSRGSVRRRSGTGEPPAPFIVGVPRSGTTLLRLMLDAHPDLAIPPETQFVPLLIDRWREWRESGVDDAGRRRRAFELITTHPRWPDLEVTPEALRERLDAPGRLRLADAVRALHLVYASERGKPRWGDKSPNYLTAMPRIQQSAPEVRFVHVIRDGRAVALSLGEVSWGTRDVAEAAQRWERRIRAARRQAQRLSPSSYVELRYEDLVTDPAPTLKRVSEAIELPWHDAMLAYHEDAAERMASVRRNMLSRHGRRVSAEERERQHALVSEPPRVDRITRWREELAPADRRRFEEEAGGLLVELGYPVGDL